MILEHNRKAWDAQVEGGNEWTIPVTPEQVAEARAGNVRIVLTPTVVVPRDWYPPLQGAKVLCLASGGGQQGPLLAAAGADVTVFDNSPLQLQRDHEVAARENLSLETIQGDMADLQMFAADSFDLIVHPVSNVFVPDVRQVWREAHRVLKPGACMISGVTNPIAYLFDQEEYERGNFVVRHKLPYSDAENLSPEERARWLEDGRPLEFSHTLEDQIGGQIAAGFAITGFYEDRYPKDDPLSEYMAWFFATRAMKLDAGWKNRL